MTPDILVNIFICTGIICMTILIILLTVCCIAMVIETIITRFKK